MAQLIYIGIRKPMDTNERNYTNENSSVMQGTYDETQMQNVSVSMTEKYHPGHTYSDDAGRAPDTFTYDLGNGPITSGLDGEARFLAEVIPAGSDTPESMQVSLYQLANGATFVRLPDGFKINSLTIKEMSSDGYAGIYTNSSSTSTVVCFVADTWVETPDGPRKVQDLAVGDEVSTLDHGPQAIRWAARWTVASRDRTAPIRFDVGSLGRDIPYAPLCVSRQHRLFVQSPVARHMFGTSGALIAAHRLVGLPGVSACPGGGLVEYVHFLCARHEIVRSNGAFAETLLNAPQSRNVVATGHDTAPFAGIATTPARPLLSPGKQRQFVARLGQRAARHGKAEFRGPLSKTAPQDNAQATRVVP